MHDPDPINDHSEPYQILHHWRKVHRASSLILNSAGYMGP